DLLNFVSQAGRDLAVALRQRGDGFNDLTSRKQGLHPIELSITFNVPEAVRSKIVAVGTGNDPILRVAVWASPHLRTLTYSLRIDKGTFQEELKTENVHLELNPATLVRVAGESQSWNIAWNQMGYRLGGAGKALQSLVTELATRESGSGLVRLGFGH